ncbi:MAG: glycosyl hydrolase [Bacteroidota bacterium]
MYRLTLPFIICLTCCTSFAQTPGELLLQGYEARNKMSAESLLANYPARNIGPTVQGGRVVDIDVNANNVNEYYVAFASGGLFKTTNSGITFESIFDGNGALGIGDIALAPSNNAIIYVGTGEKNSSRSSYAGTGIYKSEDGGNSWVYIGLHDSQHISRVIVHPDDPETVWVASLGALYSKNDTRGVFKSTDGGKTWDKTLYINDSTGIVDLVVNPRNPRQLWAASWERSRSASKFKGNGTGSGIYRSNDGGENWFKSMDGFPDGPQVGRIGLAVSPTSPSIIYAFLDNQAEEKEAQEEDEDDKLKINDFSEMTIEALMKLETDEFNDFLKSNGYPEKYDANRVKKEVKEGKYKPEDIANYFGDANANLFNTSVIGAELYRSDDSGSTWKKMNSYDLDGVYFTYGYYFGEVRVSTQNPDQIYVFGVPLLKSNDSGITYSRIDSLGDVHVDHQALWINPKNENHLRLGNDGGLYESYDGGAYWAHINNMPVGQFYTVNVDMEKSYNVYGGLQDNGSLVGSSNSIPNRTKKWERVFGGDGMFIAPDPRNSDLVYTGFQFGNYYKKNRRTNKTDKITPQHDIGEDKLRFNWRTPLVLSSHNPDIVYLGSQKLYRSFNKGDDWEPISPDLTKNLPQGNVPFSTITEVSESILQFGLIYVGTDDGNVQMTKSAGDSWVNVSSGLPNDKWVSSVSTSPHEKGHVFVALNGYRNDDFRTYVFKSENYGKSWTSIKSNLPEMVVNDLIQDPVNPNLLYLGSDNGTYVSMDRGESWQLLSSIPNVASYDLIVHPRDNELVVATHGRSIYVVDVKPLQAVAGTDAEIKAFAKSNIRHSERWGERRYEYLKPFDPKVDLDYFIRSSGNVTVQILDKNDNVIRSFSRLAQSGFNRTYWDLRVNKPVKKKNKGQTQELVYADKGKYKIRFTKDTVSEVLNFEVR